MCNECPFIFDGIFSVGAAVSRSKTSECAESSLLQYIYHQVIQQNESEAKLWSVFSSVGPAPEDS